MHLSHICPNGSQCNDVHWRHVRDEPHCSRMQICECQALCKCGPFFFYYYCFFWQMRVNRGSNMLFGCWTSCEPSCEDVHNSLSPPGTLYFHGPASDVNAPAVLWIVRTDYSVGGRGLGVSVVCFCRMWCACVCACVAVSMLLRMCVCVFMFACACMWSVNVSLASGACVCVWCECSVQKACTVPWIRNVLKWMRAVMWGRGWGRVSVSESTHVWRCAALMLGDRP